MNTENMLNKFTDNFNNPPLSQLLSLFKCTILTVRIYKPWSVTYPLLIRCRWTRSSKMLQITRTKLYLLLQTHSGVILQTGCISKAGECSFAKSHPQWLRTFDCKQRKLFVRLLWSSEVWIWMWKCWYSLKCHCTGWRANWVRNWFSKGFFAYFLFDFQANIA